VAIRRGERGDHTDRAPSRFPIGGGGGLDGPRFGELRRSLYIKKNVPLKRQDDAPQITITRRTKLLFPHPGIRDFDH